MLKCDACCAVAWLLKLLHATLPRSIGLSALFNHFLHQLHDEYVMHPAAMMLLPPLAVRVSVASMS